MIQTLELLAPAKNLEIGIAAIDCGADAVYIAGPDFGARKSAANPIEDIKKLCDYAKQYGVRIFITLNTLIYEDELDKAKNIIDNLIDAGVDAIIAQDLAVIQLVNGRIPVHASTQCAIQNQDRAKFLSQQGFSRLVLERAMSLKEISKIHNSTDSELEFFVHGAICVCYSGQCYISEALNARSANRGDCMQACRSRYDLIDSKGKYIIKNKALLSLKDYQLLDSLEDLAKAGVCSFKIEGRLKNISYVKNVVRAYSIALDKIIAEKPELYRRSSFGKVHSNFIPDLNKTFNRSYTSLFLDGKRGKWASLDTAKGMGEEVGVIASFKSISKDDIEIKLKFINNNIVLSNGDGFSFYTDKDIIGFRADIVQNNTITTKQVSGLYIGAKVYRNLNVKFEKSISNDNIFREISVSIKVKLSKKETFNIECIATSEDGRKLILNTELKNAQSATNWQRSIDMLNSQLSKRSLIYKFNVDNISYTDTQDIPHLSSADINNIRRDLASNLHNITCNKIDIKHKKTIETSSINKDISYKENIANSISKNLLAQLGAESIEDAYEVNHRTGIELMRTKYCIKYELGICPRFHKAKETEQLYLLNNKRKFPLIFDCKRCEMVVAEAIN